MKYRYLSFLGAFCNTGSSKPDKNLDTTGSGLSQHIAEPHNFYADLAPTQALNLLKKSQNVKNELTQYSKLCDLVPLL
jgi:hypothetical protein